MGGGGGQDNNVHVTAFGDHAQNTGIYSIFCSLYNILRTEVEQDTLSQAFMYNILRKDVGAKQVVTSIYAFGEHAQNTGIYSVFASLYSILCT